MTFHPHTLDTSDHVKHTISMNYEALWNGLMAAAEKSTMGYASFKDGQFCLYCIPVGNRTTWRRPHYRITHYLLNADGATWDKVSKDAFMTALKGGQQ